MDKIDKPDILVLNSTYIITLLRKYDNFNHSLKKGTNLTISKGIENTPELSDVACIKITYTCDGLSNVQYFHPFEYAKAATAFRCRLLSDDPSIFSISGSTLEDIKKRNQQISEEISGRDKLVHEIDQDTVFKSLCVNGSFTYKHGDSCYASITIHDSHQESEKVTRKLLITFVNQISEEAYTRFVPIEDFEFGVSNVFLKLLKNHEIVFHINNN